MQPDDRFFQRIFDSISDPLAIYDRHFRILTVNRALSSLYQLDPQEVLGRRCYEIFQGRRKKCQSCHVEELFRSGQRHKREKLIHLPDQSQRHFEIHCYPVRDGRGKTILAIEHGRDISMRKNLEGRLLASEEKHRTMVKMAREGIAVIDPEGKLSFVNQFLAESLGYAVSEILGQPFMDVVAAEARDLMAAKLEERSSGLAEVYELRLQKNTGGYLMALISAAPIVVADRFLGSIAVITDITHLKEVETELHQANEFVEKLVNGIPDNFVVIDPRTYGIVKVNHSFLRRVALDRDSVLGKPCYEIMLGRQTPCAADGTFCPVQETARTQNPALYDRSYPDRQGREHLLQIATYPLLDTTGEVELVIRLERDITEKREMEEALAFRSRELQKAQHQLETLFEVSRQVSANNSLPGLLQSLHEIAQEMFPASEPVFLLLNENSANFLGLEECGPHLAEPTQRLQLHLAEAGLTKDFIHYLKEVTDSLILTHEERAQLPEFLRSITRPYQSWCGLPILAQRQCLGFFLLGSQDSRNFPREDMLFVQALFGQIAGFIRHLVLHEVQFDHLHSPEKEKSSHAGIIGKSKKMQEIYELIDLISKSDATVLITGEHGTGKELVAQAIHRQSHRHRGPFVVANCSAYSPTLLESELFGHERGAFTGAIRQRKGRIERSHGGTLFMDEIGDISPATQVLLLRFLQDHCFERVGGERPIVADVRVLAATNRDLRQVVEAGQFREDLYYRLNVIAIHLPPLRERKDDIPLLAMHFLKKYAAKEGKRITNFAGDAMESLLEYSWPGNVRQLENAVSHAVILGPGGVIQRKHFPRFLRESAPSPVSTSLAENERHLIVRVLQEANWNKHEAARRLKVTRSTLYSKIRRYGLDKGSILRQR